MNRQSDELSRRYRIFFSLFLMLCANLCLAAPEDFSEQSLIGDMPVVLSASRLRQPVSESPNAVTIIDKAMIKASGFRTTADLFRLVPGMYVDYQSGNEPLVGYRGATDAFPRRMQVLVDGRSVVMPPFDIVNWSDLPLHIDDIERIEVVRGPAATSYGSNSILGVINIITRDASAIKGASISATKGDAGGAGISDTVAHLGNAGELLDYRLTLGMRSDNGFNFPADYNTTFDGYNNSSATHIANLRSNYHPTGTDSFDLQLGYSNGVQATGNPQLTLSPPRNMLTNSGFQQLSWLHVLDKGDDLQLHYYHISFNLKDERFSLPISGVSYWISDGLAAQRHELELQHTVRTSPENRFVWGVAMRDDAVDAPSLFLAPQSLHESRLFAHDEWRVLPPLLVNIGAMLEDDGMGNRRTSPRLSLNYHITPLHTLRAGVSVAYRNPAIGEESSNYRYILGSNLYQEWLSSGGLRPERALSREIGYIGELGAGLSIDVRAYNDQMSDMIWVDPVSVNIPGLISQNSYAWDFRNEFSAQYTGVEGTIKSNWERGSLTFSFAHQLVSADLTTASQFLPAYFQSFSSTTPLNSGSLLFISKLKEDLSLSAGYYYQDAVQVLDGVYPQPIMHRLDMRLAKQFGSMGDKKIGGSEVAFVVQNALQEDFVGYSGYVFNRRAFVKATIGF